MTGHRPSRGASGFWIREGDRWTREQADRTAPAGAGPAAAAGTAPGAGAATVSTAGSPRPYDALPVAHPVIVDAGSGNLGNLARALRHLGAEPEVTSSPDRLAGARCLLLPGVGAFAAVRGSLRGPLEDALRAALGTGAWLLGICVGFQVLFDEGKEFGTTDGLGLLPGRVTRLPDGVPLPHIGWNRLHDLADHPLLSGLGSPAVAPETTSEAASISALTLRPLGMTDPSDHPIHRSPASEGPHVYFVHSFAPEAVPAGLRLASATHGRTFPAVAASGRIMGTQFHPERSGAAGLRLLGNYLRLAGGL